MKIGQVVLSVRVVSMVMVVHWKFVMEHAELFLTQFVTSCSVHVSIIDRDPWKILVMSGNQGCHLPMTTVNGLTTSIY